MPFFLNILKVVFLLLQGGPPPCTPRHSVEGRPIGQVITEIYGGCTIISGWFDFGTDIFELVTTEGSKFHILHLLHMYFCVVNTFFSLNPRLNKHIGMI